VSASRSGVAQSWPRDGSRKVFRDDLDWNPRDGRALSGLRDCLKAQDRQYEAEQIDRQFRSVWKFPTAEGATTPKR